MDFILSCPPVGGDRIGKINNAIEEWLSNPELHRLVEVFGGKIPSKNKLDDYAKWFLEFSNCWDFRANQKQAYDAKVGEGVRWMVKSENLTELQKNAALKAASSLGLRGIESPAFNSYDYIWVLGGARMSCLLRTRKALKTVNQMESAPKSLIMLASMRPIGDSEREATNTYAPKAETEFDLFVAAFEKEQSCCTSTEERYDDTNNPNSSWIVRKYPIEGSDAIIIAAPSSEPNVRRANSADTYQFFFEQFKPKQGASILLVTSQIYVPYQHMEAIRTIAIPYDIYLDTIGFPLEWNGTLQGMNEPSNYLQEIRSTIQSFGRFLNI